MQTRIYARKPSLLVGALFFSLTILPMLVACEGLSVAAGSTSPEGNSTSEGTADSPVDISGNFPVMYDGSVGPGENSFYQLAVTSGNNYTFSLTGMSNDHDLYVYADPDWTILLCSSTLADAADDVCSTDASTTTIYITILDHSGQGGDFSLEITDNTGGGSGLSQPGQNEATVVVDSGNEVLYSAGAADFGSPSSADLAYTNPDPNGGGLSFIGIDFSAATTVNLSGNSFGTANFYYTHPGGQVFFPIDGCTFIIQDAYSIGSSIIGYIEDCNVESAGITHTVSLLFNYSIAGGGGSDFNDEGSVASPVDISNTFPIDYDGEVGSGSNSYYQLTVTDGNNYTFELTGLSGDQDLYVYSDSGFSSALCTSTNSGSGDESCASNATGATVYIRVLDWSLNGGYFSIEVTDNGSAGGSNEGSQVSPVDITGSFPIDRASTVDASGSSYYQVDVTDGNNYTIETADATNDFDLFVYSDASFSTVICSQETSSGNESCDVDATGVSTLYIRVFDWSGSGGSFDLELADNGAPASTYVIETIRSGNAELSDTFLTIYEDDGVTQVSGCDFSTDDDGGTDAYSYYSLITCSSLPSGDYYAVVTDEYSDTGGYAISIRETGSEGTCSASAVDEGDGSTPDSAEDDDDSANAVTLSIGCSNQLTRNLELADQIGLSSPFLNGWAVNSTPFRMRQVPAMTFDCGCAPTARAEAKLRRGGMGLRLVPDRQKKAPPRKKIPACKLKPDRWSSLLWRF